jgi:DNA-directed RNA polymerase subunit L
MELEVLEEDKNRLVFELTGADHTFCNVLKKELWNDDYVTSSAYSIDHPLVGQPKLIVETKGNKKASSALADAADRIKEQNDEFLDQFTSAF